MKGLIAIWIVAQGQAAPIESSRFPDMAACIEGRRAIERARAEVKGAQLFIKAGKPPVRILRTYCAPAAR